MFKNKLIFITLFWLLLAATTFLLLIEVKPSPQTWPKDKLEHAIFFGLLTYLGIKTYPKYIFYIGIGLAIYGGIMEQAQSLFTLTRTGSIGDWLADLTGIILVVFAINFYKNTTAL